MKSAALIVLSSSKNPSLGTAHLYRIFSSTDPQSLYGWNQYYYTIIMPIRVNADLQLLEKATSIFTPIICQPPWHTKPGISCLTPTSSRREQSTDTSLSFPHRTTVTMVKRCSFSLWALTFGTPAQRGLGSSHSCKDLTIACCSASKAKEMNSEWCHFQRGQFSSVFLGRKGRTGRHRNSIKAFKMARG